VAVLTAGVTTDGLPYYTMPFVEGESLRARLARGGALPVPEAVSALKDVARALAYAHGHGVVHRDVKPENILLTGGAAVVADFGIAKAVSAAGGAATLTQLGMAVGTPAYMAPEQAAGQDDVDHRADLYAWGMVAWELLAGQHPFAPRTTPQALIAAHFVEVPAPLADRCPGVPAPVAAVIMRCLEKDPDHRPASAAEVLLALDAPAPAAAAPSAAPPVAAGPAPAARAAVPAGSIAVLPFANRSAEADDEYFSDGMTEEVINALARLPGVRVAARTSAFAFKGQRIDLRSIGEQLRVATVLEGSVRRAGRRVRVSAQLASASDGLHLWSERYDRELTDVFALQDEIAEAIARALGERLAGGRGSSDAVAAPIPPGGAVARRHVSPAAYEQFLRGRFLFERGAPSLVPALGHFERAAALAPDFPDAHSWLGMTCNLLAVYGLLPADDGFTRARTAADRALVFEPEHAHALTVRLLVALWFDWDGAAAEALGRRAVAVGDGVADAHQQLGWALLAAERFDEADAAMARALALDPLSMSTVTARAFSLLIGRRPAAAVSTMDDWLARLPLDAEAHRLRGLALEAADRLDEACDAFRRAGALDPTNRFAPGDLAATLALVGRRDEARRLLGEMEDRARGGPPPAMMLALVHHALGDDALAFTWLERALEAREFWLSMMHVDPMFRRMWGDARFTALVRRVGVARTS
jgi:serine/threonine-protein kinase